jgi:hypothetical protein
MVLLWIGAFIRGSIDLFLRRKRCKLGLIGRGRVQRDNHQETSRGKSVPTA